MEQRFANNAYRVRNHKQLAKLHPRPASRPRRASTGSSVSAPPACPPRRCRTSARQPGTSRPRRSASSDTSALTRQWRRLSRPAASGRDSAHCDRPSAHTPPRPGAKSGLRRGRDQVPRCLGAPSWPLRVHFEDDRHARAAGLDGGDRLLFPRIALMERGGVPAGAPSRSCASGSAARCRRGRPNRARPSADLAADANGGIVVTGGGRYFGFVIGGAVPASPASGLAHLGLGPECGALRGAARRPSVVEEVANQRLAELLGLPADVSSATSPAARWRTSPSSAARYEVLHRAGWDVSRDWLRGATQRAWLSSARSRT